MRVIIYTYLCLLTIILPLSIIAGDSFLQEEDSIDVTQLISEEETEDDETIDFKAFHEEFIALISNNLFLDFPSKKTIFKEHFGLLSGVNTDMINPPELI